MITKEILEQLKQASAKGAKSPWNYDEKNSELLDADGRMLHRHCVLGEIFDKSAGNIAVLARNYLDSLIERIEELEDDVNILDRANVSLGDSLEDHADRFKSLTAENTRLREDADKMREYIEFYADKKNWIIRKYGEQMGCDLYSYQDQISKSDIETDHFETRKKRTLGGKRARECLASLDAREEKKL